MSAQGEDSSMRAKNRNLKQFYGLKWNEDQICDPFDMKSQDFNSDLYLTRLLKECGLSQLMDKEQALYKQIQTLDSEMQTLVYENYNKFISATETIRKMSSHFNKMEEELELLAKNMDAITKCSEQISTNLSKKRGDLNKLSSRHSILTKLQFLFELAPKMRACIERNACNEAVRYYLKAEKTLEQYKHFPSISVIAEECKSILEELKEILHNQLASRETSPNKLNEIIELLLQLKEPPEKLCHNYLLMSKQKFNQNISELDYQLDLLQKVSSSSSDSETPAMDVLEFVDLACNGFLSSLSLAIVSYEEIFLNKLSGNQVLYDATAIRTSLKEFVEEQMNIFFEKIISRFKLEKTSTKNCLLFVRSLDRFYRRVQILNKSYGSADFTQKALEIVERASENHCNFFLSDLKTKFLEELANVRHSIVSAASAGVLSPKTSMKSENKTERHVISDILITLQTKISELIKSAIAGLSAFNECDVTFATKNFQHKFSVEFVREGIVIGFIKFVLETSANYEKSYLVSTSPPQLILLLSRLCLDLENSLIGYLLAFTDEQLFNLDVRRMKSQSEINPSAKEVAQRLLNHYVRLEGQSISQMIRKSVETRDWLSSVEPRSVRSVMKRVVEDISAIDLQVGQLYEEGTRFERSSDSSRSRRTFSAIGFGGRHNLNKSSNWSAYGSSNIDNNLMSNIQKLFSERIEIFSSVEFSKLSVVTGIIKIGLKTLIECVRLCTFSRFGLQQVQVDAYYLQTHVWAFVSDENLVSILIDEVLSSAFHRCLDPVFMEMSVIEKICEGV